MGCSSGSGDASSSRLAATHNGPIFLDLATTIMPSGRDQLWVAAIPGGFAYVAMILDAWSRRVVGYAIRHSIDTRLALAALRAAIVARRPPTGWAHYSDRGLQHAAEAYRLTLAANGLIDPLRVSAAYDNAKASGKHSRSRRGGLPHAYEGFEDVAAHLPHFIEEVYNRRLLHSSPGF
jgi:putative transposase